MNARSPRRVTYEPSLHDHGRGKVTGGQAQSSANGARMMTTNTSESGLEALIESALTGGSHSAAVVEDSPVYSLDGGAYIQGSAADYDRGWRG